MIPYADTNFLIRAYLELGQSPEADRLINRAKQQQTRALPITWLHRLEVTNAIQLHVFFARSPGQVFITPQQAALAQANFRADLEVENFIYLASIPMPALELQFEELTLRHTAKHGFRTYDLVHVASALLLKCDTFWSFDPKASKLAALEGLRTHL